MVRWRRPEPIAGTLIGVPLGLMRLLILGHAAECEPALHNGKSGVRSRRKPLRDNDVSEFHDRP
jgi:hypothetical protein